METITFTKSALDKISAPKKGRISYKDNKEQGLALYVTQSGVKTFYVRKRVQGKDERIILGRFPEMSVEQARKKALEAKAAIALGKDPTEEKRRLRHDIAFRDMFEEFLSRYAKHRKKTWPEDKRMINHLASHLLHRKVSQIPRQEWQALHEKIGHNNGYYQANRFLACVRVIYNKAIEWGWEGINPTLGIKKFKEKSRDRFLRKEELPRFFEALAQEENNSARDYMLISLLTGARKSNVLAMRWADIHFEAEEWRIPETKNGDPHTVPLSAPALEILKERPQVGEYVFPGHGASGHLADPKKAWQRILKHAGIEDLRLHDLRRTLGSWMAMSGATTAMIGKTLAHKSLHTTQIYERLDLDPVRLSIERATAAMFNTLKPEDKK